MKAFLLFLLFSFQDPLNISFLTDVSGSMKVNDPQNLRKISVLMLTNLLKEDDRISLVTFGNNGKIILDWINANEKEKVFKEIEKLESNDKFTDFLSGFKEIEKLFSEPSRGKNIIVLLTDGIYEPNPSLNEYQPYNIEYKRKTMGKNKEEIKKIDEEFKERLRPVGERKLLEEIIPLLQKKNIELFVIGLSENVDKDFLGRLSEELTLSPTESHLFFANRAIDLMSTFISLLQYWSDFMILKDEEGNITANVYNEIGVDEYIENCFVIAVTEKQADFTVEGAKETTVKEIVPPHLTYYKVPGGEYTRWRYGFSKGSGKYRVLWVGKNAIQLKAEGLKSEYQFGDSINLRVYVEKDGKNILNGLKNPNLKYLISPQTDFSEVSHESFCVKEEELFNCNFTLRESGKNFMKLILHSQDSEGRDILPRPSKILMFKILPIFYVKPDKEWFIKNAKRNREYKREFTIISGYPDSLTVNIWSNNLECTNPEWRKKLENVPVVKKTPLKLPPFSNQKVTISLLIPPKSWWGDYQGEIVFAPSNLSPYKIKYRIHIPSIWEKLTIPLILISFIFTGVVILWRTWCISKPLPSGVLKFINLPLGSPIIPDIYLSRIKKNIFKRWMACDKNIIRIQQKGGDVNLPFLPQDAEIILEFTRYLILGETIVLIKNVSSKNSNFVIRIQDPNSTFWLDRRTGQVYKLNNGSHILIGNYEIKFLR